jgi:hypothetical protein
MLKTTNAVSISSGERYNTTLKTITLTNQEAKSNG